MVSMNSPRCRKRSEIYLFDSLGSPRGHDIHFRWATYRHQGDVLHGRIYCCDRLGHCGRASVRIWRTQPRGPQEQDCGGRLHIYRHIAAGYCHKHRYDVAGVAHASAAAIAAGPERRKGGEDTTTALPRYDCYLLLII